MEKEYLRNDNRKTCKALELIGEVFKQNDVDFADGVSACALGVVLSMAAQGSTDLAGDVQFIMQQVVDKAHLFMQDKPEQAASGIHAPMPSHYKH